MAKITLQLGKSYTYTGNADKYTLIVGELIDGGPVSGGSTDVPIMRYGEGPPSPSLGKTGDIYIDVTNSTLYTKSSSGWGEGTVFKGEPGVDGADGTSGTSAINGVLTNDNQIVPASDTGLVTDNLSSSGGEFLVFNGSSQLASGVTYEISDDGETWTSSTVTVHGIVGQIDSTGAYSFTNTGWSLLVDSITFYFRATAGESQVAKSFTLVKSKGGRSARLIRLNVDKLAFTIDGAGLYTPTSQTITLTAFLQNYSETQTVSWTVEKLESGSWVDVTTVGDVDTLGYGANPYEASITNTSFDEVRGSSQVLRISATAEMDGTTQTDTVSIVALRDGASAISGVLTNEVHLVAASVDGIVSDTLATAGGTFLVYLGGVVQSGIDFYLEQADGDDFESASVGVPAVVTKSGVTMSLDSDGVYTLSQSGDGWTTDADTITFTLKAGGVGGSGDITKTYTISKSKGGSNAKLVYLTSDSQSFKKNDSDAYNPTAQTIRFTSQRQNITSLPTWDFYALVDGTWVASSTYTSGIDYTVIDDNTIEVTNSQYDGLLSTLSGTGTSVKVRATAEGLFDEVSVIVVKDGGRGEKGETGDVGPAGATLSAVLTNESLTVAALSDGTVDSTDLTNSAGSMLVYYGTISATDPTSGQTVTFGMRNADDTGNVGADTQVKKSGLIATIDASGNYTLTADTGGWSTSVDTVSFTFRAYVTGTDANGNPTEAEIFKTFTITKAKSGTSAKVLVVTTDRNSFNYDGTGSAFNPASQTVVFTAALSNLTGTPTWVAQALGSNGAVIGSNLTNSTHYAVSGNTLSINQTKFTQIKTDRSGAVSVKTTATIVDNGVSYADSCIIGSTKDGAAGSAGADAVSGYLTNEAYVLTTSTNGSYSTSTLGAAAGGTFKVLVGNTVSNSSGDWVFTVAGGVTVSSNHIAVVNGLTVVINKTTGVYSFSGSSWTSSSEAIEFTATNSKLSATVTKVYTITKAVGKSISISGSPLFSLNTAGTGAATPTAVQTYTATLSGMTGSNATFTLGKYKAGSLISSPTLASYATVIGNTVRITAANFVTAAGLADGSGDSLRLSAYADDNVVDYETLIGVPQGATGNNAKTIVLSSDKTAFTVSPSDGATLRPTSQTATFRASLQNCTGSNPTWTVVKMTNAGVATTLTGSLSDYITISGATATMTGEQFTRAKGEQDYVRVSASADSIADYVSLFKMKDGSGGVVVYKTSLIDNHFLAANASDTATIAANVGSPYAIRQASSPDINLDGVITTSSVAQSGPASPLDYFTKFTVQEAGTYEITVGSNLSWDGGTTTSSYYPAQFKYRTRIAKYVVSSWSYVSSCVTQHTVEDDVADSEFASHVHTVTLAEGAQFKIDINRSKSIALASGQPTLAIALSSTDSYISIKKV